MANTAGNGGIFTHRVGCRAIIGIYHATSASDEAELGLVVGAGDGQADFFSNLGTLAVRDGYGKRVIARFTHIEALGVPPSGVEALAGVVMP